MGQKRIVTLVKSNENQRANIGKHFFNVNVPKLVHFTDEEMKKYVEPCLEFIQIHFKIEKTELDIKEGESKEYTPEMEKKKDK